MNFYSTNKKLKDGTSYTYYRPDCKTCANKKAMKWIKDNPKRYKEIRSKTENKKKTKDLTRKRIKKFRGSDKYKVWVENNKELLQKYSKNRLSNKTHIISKEEWTGCKNYFNNSCAYCGLHLENHYRMWLGEPKKIDLHKEHVDHQGSNKLDNCVPSCQSCNSSKWEYSLEEWYKEDNTMTKFSHERLKKIQKWLKEDYKIHIKNINT
ncbi:hypothetical protein ABD91_00645 [Lysinibacillus sphaericus]|nr:hypothetical protein [Lysinibacillus sphaericus]